MKIEYNPIGIVHTPFKDLNGIPNQPSEAKGVEGTIVLFPEFQKGLKDLNGFSHIVLLCHFHMTSEHKLVIIPSGETKPRGLFSTRSPNRPNPIGLSIVRLNQIRDNLLMISDLDILDGTPVLDIKPYFRENQFVESIKTGWMEKSNKKRNYIGVGPS
jgi:tRNA-Thr(GGU) m(6)t(6)A37 methyltransferase TsaA